MNPGSGRVPAVTVECSLAQGAVMIRNHRSAAPMVELEQALRLDAT